MHPLVQQRRQCLLYLLRMMIGRMIIEHMAFAAATAGTLLEASTPQTFQQAMKSPDADKWKAATDKEMASCEKNGVWELVPRSSVPRGNVVINCKWVFKIKTDENGAVTVYKARLTPKGFQQKEGINYHETFAATGKYKSMRIGLSLTAACDHELDQMDVPVAFQNPVLDEDEVIFMELPPGYTEGKEHLVCRLISKSLYGLKQASRKWWLLITNFLIGLGFMPTVSDPCLLFKRSRTGRLIIIFLVCG